MKIDNLHWSTLNSCYCEHIFDLKWVKIVKYVLKKLQIKDEFNFYLGWIFKQLLKNWKTVSGTNLEHKIFLKYWKLSSRDKHFMNQN